MVVIRNPTVSTLPLTSRTSTWSPTPYWSSTNQQLGFFGNGNGFIDGNGQFNSQVSFVTGRIYVVVESDGAWIDTNAEGIHDD